MFRKREDLIKSQSEGVVDRVTSVLGEGTNLNGRLTGRGGVRIEGSFEGEISLNGLLVIGTTGRVTCEQVQANTVIIAGALRGNIVADKVEIRSTGRVWGNITTGAFATEEGAFLRGQIQMEEVVVLDLPQEESDALVETEIILNPQSPGEPDELQQVNVENEPIEHKPVPKAKLKTKTGKAKKKTKKAKKSDSK